MFHQIELFLLGVATVFDTVLLLIVLERVNRGQVASWLYTLLLGLWLVHGSSFAHELLRDVPGLLLARHVLMLLTCVGLLLLPTGLLHAALWLNFGQRERQWRYGLIYLPLVTLPWLAWHLVSTTEVTFIEAVRPIAGVYLTIVLMANLLSMALFLRVRHRLPAAGAAPFFLRLAVMLVWMTAVLLFYFSVHDRTAWEELTRVVLILSPLFPAMLFVWYSLNQRLLPLVMERTLLYGAAVVTLLFLHRLLIEPIASNVQAKANVDVLMVEGWLLVAIVLAWPPLRCRFREAVRYLVSSNVHQIRQATQQLSVELSQLSAQTTEELTAWMAESLRLATDVDSVMIALERTSDQAGNIVDADAITPQVEIYAVSSNQQASKQASFIEDLSTLNRQALGRLYTAICAEPQPYLFRGQRLPSQVEQAFVRLGAMWIFRMQFRAVRGIVLIGPRLRNDRLADEQLSSLSLLVEQFAATLNNRQLDQQRLRAERHAMQQEKLSVLGLLAGTLSHELRNPLSSMRTIATLMQEDIGADSPHARDVKLILGEIDRLTQTTTRLLDFSRPASDERSQVEPAGVLSRLLAILEHFARQRDVVLEVRLANCECQVSASDASLSEILFNLIKNAIEAAGASTRIVPPAANIANPERSDHVPKRAPGKVIIETQLMPGHCRFVIADNGSGVTADLQATMFEPFVTGKSDGTGLGLYVVAQRVRELKGTIRCENQPQGGARFEVTLPRAV